jgi:hypothetical protein
VLTFALLAFLLLYHHKYSYIHAYIHTVHEHMFCIHRAENRSRNVTKVMLLPCKPSWPRNKSKPHWRHSTQPLLPRPPSFPRRRLSRRTTLTTCCRRAWALEKSVPKHKHEAGTQRAEFKDRKEVKGIYSIYISKQGKCQQRQHMSDFRKQEEKWRVDDGKLNYSKHFKESSVNEPNVIAPSSLLHMPSNCKTFELGVSISVYF